MFRICWRSLLLFVVMSWVVNCFFVCSLCLVVGLLVWLFVCLLCWFCLFVRLFVC